MLRQLSTWWRFRNAVRQAAGETDRKATHSRDVVVLPCWRRPEFLWHCLENISQADGASDLIIHIRPDSGYAPENLEVVRSFSDRLEHIEIQWPTPAAFRRTKQSANVLLGYLRAAAQAARYVFLVEEDVMVARDFFRWHRAVQAAASRPLFCSIASVNTNRKVTLPQRTEDFYLSSGDFCSIGVCFDKRVLQQQVAPHVNMGYMRSPKKYIRRHFPASRIGLGFVEQDGLIRRIQQRGDDPIAWPSVPRAFHAGFYGYNRPGEIAGGLQDRIETLSQTIYSSELMRGASTRPEFVESSMPCDLQLPGWTALREVEVALPEAELSS